MAQWAEDLALSLRWLGSLLWQVFHSWPGNFHRCSQKKKKVISEAGESRTESRPWQEKVPLLRSWREGADLSGLGNKWGL